jgi:hypothetical protein
VESLSAFEEPSGTMPRFLLLTGSTHLKIVLIALIASIAVSMIGIGCPKRLASCAFAATGRAGRTPLAINSGVQRRGFVATIGKGDIH